MRYFFGSGGLLLGLILGLVALLGGGAVPHLLTAVFAAPLSDVSDATPAVTPFEDVAELAAATSRQLELPAADPKVLTIVRTQVRGLQLDRVDEHHWRIADATGPYPKGMCLTFYTRDPGRAPLLEPGSYDLASRVTCLAPVRPTHR